MNFDPIFVVGTPRSGTTLLASLLCAHSNIGGGPETFFFSDLSKTNATSLEANWPHNALRFVEQLQVEGDRVADLYGIPQPELLQALLQRSPSIRSILEAVAATHAARDGKRRWLEKTPRHLLHVHEIRRTFPDAIIIRIVRDPRDVALSLQKVPWASDDILVNVYRCITDFERSESFFEQDRNCLTVKYERLATDSEYVLREVCASIGEQFEAQMLTPLAAGALVTSKEHWKSKTAHNVDASRVAVWKQEFPSELQPAADLICSEILARFEYERTAVPERTIAVSPWAVTDIEKSKSDIIEGAKVGTRYMPACRSDQTVDWHRLESAEEVILKGVPQLGHHTGERIHRSLHIASSLMMRRLRNQRSWLLPTVNAADRSKAGRLCNLMLRSLCKQPVPEDPPTSHLLDLGSSHG